MSIHETQYRLTLLGDGLQGLGLSMSIHLDDLADGITDLHAQRLSHLVECCGMLAEKLAEDLDRQIDKGGE